MQNVLRLRAYSALVKPGIIMGNAITATAGFALAAKDNFDFGLFASMLTGLSLIIASGCAFNNFIDRAADQKMARTQKRPLATGAISAQSAIVFAIVLFLAGIFLLSTRVNLVSAAIAFVGFVVYVFFYSFLKYRTEHATLVGSIAGAVPPVVGHCAVSGQVDLGALLLFALLTFWQMPHFYAIAIYRSEEYAAANIPVLPLKRGIFATKVQMLVYTVGFGVSALLLTVFGFAGVVYAVIAGVIGAMWLLLSIQGFRAKNDKQWARRMFIFSLVAITLLSAGIVFNSRMVG